MSCHINTNISEFRAKIKLSSRKFIILSSDAISTDRKAHHSFIYLLQLNGKLLQITFTANTTCTCTKIIILINRKNVIRMIWNVWID